MIATKQQAQNERESLPEAPASLTIKFSWQGYDTMLTLRGHTGGEVLAAMSRAVSWLEDNHAGPTGAPAPSSNGHKPAESGSGICPIHHVQMTRREKNGDVWHSHKAVNPDSGQEYWCRGKAD